MNIHLGIYDLPSVPLIEDNIERLRGQVAWAAEESVPASTADEAFFHCIADETQHVRYGQKCYRSSSLRREIRAVSTNCEATPQTCAKPCWRSRIEERPRRPIHRDRGIRIWEKGTDGRSVFAVSVEFETHRNQVS